MNGQEHVQQALATCVRVKERASNMARTDDSRPTEWTARIDSIAQTLAGLQDRFFVRTKLCLPFAIRCADEARKVEEALAALADARGDDAHRNVLTALSTLERAARALEERSSMDGMAIT